MRNPQQKSFAPPGGVRAAIEPLEGRQLLSAGDLDPTFGTGGRFSTADIGFDHFAPGGYLLTDTVVTPDGSTLVTGPFNRPVSKFTPGGALDPAFGSGGSTVSPFPPLSAEFAALATQPDGKILVAGYALRPGTGSTARDAVVLRYTPAGQLDPTWDGDGILTFPFTFDSRASQASGLSVQPDGKVVVAGSDGVNLCAARFDTRGAFDPTFGTNGIARVDLPASDSEEAIGLALSPGGKIVLVGDTTDLSSSADPIVARLNANGLPDAAFGGKGTGYVSVSRGFLGQMGPVQVQSDGKIFLGSRSAFAVLRLDANGAPDPAFAGGRALVTVKISEFSKAFDFALLPDNRVLFTGWARDPATPIDTRSDVTLLLLRADGTPDPTFGTNGMVFTDFGAKYGEQGTSVALGPDGKVVVAGAAEVGLEEQTLLLARYEGPAVYGSVAGTVFADDDADGVHDAGEAGLAGQTVFLDLDNDATWDGAAAGELAAQTDVAGAWRFDRLLPGTYAVRVLGPPAGFRQTAPDPAGAAGGAQVVTVAAGDALTGRDFGLAPQPTRQLAAAADAYVRDGTSAAQNFGSAAQLQVKLSGGAGSTREAYLRFDLLQVGGGVTSAVLRLWGGLSADGESVAVAAYPAADVSWGEGAITWNNRPAAGGAPLASATLLGTAARWYEWDLTDYLKQQKAAGAGAVTVVLKGTAISAANAAFDSDESATAANRPQLVVKSQAADVTPPALSAVLASGSAWSAGFRGYLKSAGLGDGGYAVPVAAAQPLPWTNLDRLTLRFSEAVDVQQADLLIAGTRGAGGYGIKNFSYDPATFTATWTLAQPLTKPDRLRLSVAAGAVADLAGNGLPAVSFAFDVLPGDASRDGRVNVTDEMDVRNRMGRTAAAPGAAGSPRGYAPFADVDGSGAIDAADYAAVRSRLATTLPSPAAVVVVVAPTSLFAARRVTLAATLEGRDTATVV